MVIIKCSLSANKMLNLRQPRRMIDQIFKTTEKQHEDPEQLAIVVKREISKKFQAQQNKGEMTEAFSVRMIKELINEIEKIAFYSQAQGNSKRAAGLYNEILKLQKYLQRIDIVGFLPFETGIPPRRQKFTSWDGILSPLRPHRKIGEAFLLSGRACGRARSPLDTPDSPAHDR